MEQQTGSKLGKEYVKAVYCHPCYLTYMQSTSCETPGQLKNKSVAAQSIGEPGTQLTMRTFHTGGVAGSDITQGLPRVEELFEARQPKKAAIMTEHSGIAHVQLGENANVHDVFISQFRTSLLFHVQF